MAKVNNSPAKPDIAGLILAGGESKRMGQNKALLDVGGQSLLHYHLQGFSHWGIDAYVVSNDPIPDGVNPDFYIHDYYEGRQGPLSGLMAGLLAIDAEYIWLMNCDHYGLGRTVFDCLMDKLMGTGADIAYLKDAERDHPLLAVLRSSVRSELKAFLEQGGRGVFHFYKQLDTVAVDIENPEGVFLNINTPDEYQVLLNYVD